MVGRYQADGALSLYGPAYFRVELVRLGPLIGTESRSQFLIHHEVLIIFGEQYGLTVRFLRAKERR